MNVPEEVTYLSDDEFDWDAAVAEIDKVHCNLGADQFKEQNVENAQDVGKVDNTGIQNKCNVYGSKNDPKQPSASRLNCARQKTLESFFDGGPRKVGILPMVNESAEAETTGITLDQEAIKTWIYPANVPRRDYQFSISQTALFTNTLVSLPTGLGKTLIAAVVMYNFFRWFPDGKIVFTAPSRPLVIQQIEACHNIMGISQEFTIDMTGQMNPVQRVEFWQNKRVYFVTPQILEKDIQSGICPKEQIICLVVDEAHRASGNYSYCVVVRELMAAKVKLRILALTATPGSKQAMIQAVVDNLHISCLEYRDENDPDVCQYTHNRKLELIQVIMNAESNTVRGMFLEVMQPIVYKICSFGVFYSKDVARLTPYEFVTAREKFRQAPPPTLAQSHYGEIEGLFGVAITLYHIYKLLFSHGLRPAFEMLQQKLQQGGPFAKLMGRNTQLMEIKRLMQQIIVHGAPSPKLEKMNEIIMQHFRCQDPASTRIIIFTNFRESVKDIMESLANHSDTVKAMEFIGQSSGKCSKGQTQKTQQAVLQKFRTGGYNVLVATSIGEEGLDIMEVDLVICFDANVSPLRMIQRMGRTGRKRDGRVVVLASEGAELQGYLKKQAKNQALGKHMSNGGLRSFNFHSSPRMVPHVYKPEAQFIEISVKQFVPRGRKAKGDSSLSVDGIPRISEEEKLVLAKYFDVAGSVTWTPSLIAFPKCQLIPTPVYKVKHSCRTTSMLIDALQGLQGQPMADFKRMVFPSAGIFSGDAELSENEKEATKDEKGDRQDIEVKILDPGMEKEDCNEDLDNYCYDEGLELNSNIALDSPNVSNKNTGVEKAAAQFHNDSPLDQHLIGTPEVGESPSDMCKEYVIPNDGRIKMMDERMSNSLHRCRFSNGIVQVSAAGRLSIASPPKFPFEPKVVDDDVHVIARTPNKVSENEAKENFSPNVVQSGVPNFVDCSAWSHWQKSVDFVAETPEQIVVLSSPITETLDVKAKTPGSATANMLPVGKTMCDRSDFKRLDNEEFEYTDANKLYGRRKFSCQGANRVINYEVSQAGPNGSNGVTESKTPSPAGPLHIDKIITKPICGRTGMQMLEEFNLQASKDENSFQVCSPVISSVQKNNSACLTAADCGSNKTPLAFHRAQHLHYRKIDASSCKPRKLKRLRRVRELTSPDAHPRQLAKKKGRTNPNLGLDALQICKQRLKMVQPFIDEEAEVSTDEAPSSDDENDDSDDAEELQGFINDSGEPTPAHGGEAIDMMAIYRRSLLSQSPASSLAPWMHLLPPNATSGSSSEKSAFSNAPSSSEAAGLRSVQNISVNPDINASTVLLEDSLGPKVALSGAKQHPSGSRQEIRKRKLSFQLSGLHVNSPPEIDMHANMARSNLEETLQVRSMPGGNSSKINVVTETEQNEDLMEDNLFDGLDLDALEADAVQKLSSRHVNQVQNGPETKFPALHLDPQSLDVQEQNEDICFPSFDLGIED